MRTFEVNGFMNLILINIVMRKLLIFISFILFASHVSAQIYDPVTWDFSYEKKGDKQYELIFTATIEKNSHIYSMDIPSGGPIPTSFRFDSLPGYKLDGKTYEVTKPVEVLMMHLDLRSKHSVIQQNSGRK